jgi:CHAP domain
MRTRKIAGTVFMGLVLALAQSLPALAVENAWDCTPRTGESNYVCVEQYGYIGSDPYNVDRFSNELNGEKHGCTSFAAHMLYLFNAYDPDITVFNSAQYWDTDAVKLAGASLSKKPKVGDIAQWNADKPLVFGHVAWVEEVNYFPSGAIKSIKIFDDNASLGFASRRILYPTATKGVISWPDNFITFPGFKGLGAGAGKPPAFMSIPLDTSIG